MPVGAQIRGDVGQARLHKLLLGVIAIEIELLDQPQLAALAAYRTLRSGYLLIALRPTVAPFRDFILWLTQSVRGASRGDLPMYTPFKIAVTTAAIGIAAFSLAAPAQAGSSEVGAGVAGFALGAVVGSAGVTARCMSPHHHLFITRRRRPSITPHRPQFMWGQRTMGGLTIEAIAATRLAVLGTGRRVADNRDPGAFSFKQRRGAGVCSFAVAG